MKQYRFQILTKRINLGVAKSDFAEIWKIYDFFVSSFLTIFYGAETGNDGDGDLKVFEEDHDLKAFYFAVRESLGIGDRFGFSRKNVRLVMVHLICVVTAYNKHL